MFSHWQQTVSHLAQVPVCQALSETLFAVQLTSIQQRRLMSLGLRIPRLRTDMLPLHDSCTNIISIVSRQAFVGA